MFCYLETYSKANLNRDEGECGDTSSLVKCKAGCPKAN